MKQQRKEKKSTSSSWTLKKAGLVGFGILFVVLMVVSSLGFGWTTGLVTAKPGDSVTLDFTLLDSSGRPLVTSYMPVFNQSIKDRQMTFLSPPLTAQVNVSSSKQIIAIPVYFPAAGGYQKVDYGLFSAEYNAINRGISGIKAGESRVIPLDTGYELIRNMTAEDFATMGGNISTALIGDQILVGLSNEPVIDLEENTTPSYMSRIGYITGVGEDSVILDYSHPRIEIIARDINNK